MRILCIGANHRSATVAVREKLAFDAGQRQQALRDLRGRWFDAEFAIISTCNRTEVYAARPVHGHPRAEELRDWLCGFHSLAPGDLGEAFYTLADGEAVGHLFAVAAGLDSLVPGEAQIVSQVKAAYVEAVEADCARTVMNELFQAAFHVAKHIRTETDIAMGKVSVASVAVEFVQQLFETLEDKCVLSVGAGKMNDLMLRHLGRLGTGRILVVNRSRDRAERLADACGGCAGHFERLGDHVAEADVVLTSTGAAECVITAEMVRSAQVRRRYRPLLMMDIAVPRDVDPAAGQVENVFLYNIDDLDRIVQGNLELRHSQRGAADGIVAEHVDEFLSALNVRDVTPTIQALYRSMEKLAAEELADARNRLSGHDDADEDLEILRRTLHRTIRRMLHTCTQRLRHAAGSNAARAHVAALRELFQLDLDEEEGEEEGDKGDRG
ncbi:MAG: glutamyl-tRNA reductase [Phycisphaerae bacterium]